MSNSNIELADLIEQINSAPVFSINREVERSRYQREAYQLIEQIYSYLNKLSSKYHDKGLEIVETANDCLKSYNFKTGPFLNYFMVALKKKVSSSEAQRISENHRGGIVLPEKDQQKLRQMFSISSMSGYNIDADDFINIASTIMQEEPNEIRRLLNINALATTFPECFTSDDDDISPLVERIEVDANGALLENQVLDRIWVNEFFEIIDAEFRKCKPSQQQVISKIITVRLLSELPDIVQTMMSASYAFFDLEVYRTFIKEGSLPTARQLSSDLGRNEASTSRTMKEFVLKLDSTLR